MRTPAALATLALLGSLSACGQASPVAKDPGFATAAGDQRLVAHYDQDATRATYRVAVPSGTTHLRLRMDCAEDTQREITVRVGSVGSGAVACAEGSSPGGFVGLSGAPVGGGAGAQQVSISGPKGARWSVAVDAG